MEFLFLSLDVEDSLRCKWGKPLRPILPSIVNKTPKILNSFTCARDQISTKREKSTFQFRTETGKMFQSMAWGLWQIYIHCNIIIMNYKLRKHRRKVINSHSPTSFVWMPEEMGHSWWCFTEIFPSPVAKLSGKHKHLNYIATLLTYETETWRWRFSCLWEVPLENSADNVFCFLKNFVTITYI